MHLVKKLSQKGDTIIEVLLAITIVSAMLGGAYASANSSLQGAQQSKERNEALVIAQNQLEMLDAYAGSFPNNPYNPANVYCVSLDPPYQNNFSRYNPGFTSATLNSDDFSQYAQGKVDNNGCQFGDNLSYNVADNFNGTNIVVQVRWDRLGGGRDEIRINYRPTDASSSGTSVALGPGPTIPTIPTNPTTPTTPTTVCSCGSTCSSGGIVISISGSCGNNSGGGGNKNGGNKNGGSSAPTPPTPPANTGGGGNNGGCSAFEQKNTPGACSGNPANNCPRNQSCVGQTGKSTATGSSSTGGPGQNNTNVGNGSGCRQASAGNRRSGATC